MKPRSARRSGIVRMGTDMGKKRKGQKTLTYSETFGGHSLRHPILQLANFIRIY
jgi:hypothetical protein